jgi:hypothetical protein
MTVEMALVGIGLVQTGLLFRVARSLGGLEPRVSSNTERSKANAERLEQRRDVVDVDSWRAD